MVTEKKKIVKLLTSPECGAEGDKTISFRVALKSSKECMPFSPSPMLLWERGEDDNCCNYLRPPMAVTMVITSCLAYGSPIFIGLDGLHPYLYHSSMVELFGQKMWLTIISKDFMLDEREVHLCVIISSCPLDWSHS